MRLLEQTIRDNAIGGRPTVIRPPDRGFEVADVEVLARVLSSHSYSNEGIVVIGVSFHGQLNCADFEVTAPIRLLACSFDRPLNFSRTHLSQLDLSRSVLPGLYLDGALVKHSLMLRRTVIDAPPTRGVVLDATAARVEGQAAFQYLRASGEVCLLRAFVGGQVRFRGAHLGIATPVGALAEPRAPRRSLVMDAAGVRGGIFLNGGFRASNEVRLSGARVGLQVSCAGAVLDGESNSLTMDGAEVKGGVFLTSGFTANGTVRMPQVRVALQLNCNDAQLRGRPVSLVMDGAEVQGGVLLAGSDPSEEGSPPEKNEKKFSAAGSVRCPEARIGVQLNCKRATFGGAAKALILDGASVAGSAIFELAWTKASQGDPEQLALPPTGPQSLVSLLGARIGRLRLEVTGDAEATNNQLTSKLLLEGATYQGISGPKPVRGVRLAWPRRVLAWVRGTTELEQLPGMLYRAVLVGQQEGPDGEVYPGTFDTAARVLREAGNERLARQLLIERHRQLTKRRPPLARPIGWLLDVTVGYGFRPRLALLWALLVYLGAVLVFALAVHHGGVVATPLAGTSGSPSPLRSTATYPAFSVWNYAFGALLLPFVHLPGIDAWRANATNGWGIAVRVVRWLEPVVLWSLLIILGATFTTLVTRDQR